MSDSCCSHGCASTSTAPQTASYRRILWLALLINVAMFGVELVAGLQSQSVSLLADAVDFFGDAANYGLSLAVLGSAIGWRARAARRATAASRRQRRARGAACGSCR